MKQDRNTEELFLSLVRKGIGKTSQIIKSNQVNWNALEDLAARQGLSAIVVDGIEKLPEDLRPPQQILLQWIGETLQGYEYRFELYRRTIAEMGRFFNEYQLKMMVLKGYDRSLDWPKPEHRPCGDIDIWQFGKQKEGDLILKKKKGIDVDTSEHHHTVYHWREFMVENHYDMLITSAVKTNKQLEPILKELAMDDTHFTEIYGEKVYLPSANFNALFLLRHMLMHFVAVGITFRLILDWAFFWEKHGKDVDIKRYMKVLNEFNMTTFFNIINAICVEELGFNPNIFPNIQFSPLLKEQILYDIFYPQYDKKDAHQPGVLSRIAFKYKRWKGSAWKRELCYGESSWNAFWQSVWMHLLKPSSI